MTPERYSQVKSLFQLVLEQQPDQRPAFLDRACGADRQLYNQVRELLHADSTSDSFLEKPAVTPISQVLADAAAGLHEPMPAQIGPYAIERVLGSGGMGAVYLASRADKTYNKQVAIKVIHKGMESDRILQRFRRERQIVASLDHPNIARLLDGGATNDGRPYIVMEYVEGMSIDTWCDQRKLSTEKRLRLFLQVCDAIHYAHQNLIIHRDIKPGNILVRPDGTVKLLDFGIAKIMSPDTASAVADRTATSMRLMTPQYASPEQVKGEPVTTASDVYLLGIVLYELLTGHRPYQVKDDAALEAVRAFAQGEPQKPSEAIFRTADRLLPNGTRQATRNALLVSQVRDGNPAALLKSLQGDIDAILLRALRRTPAERYQSTAQLADDIRNHLQNLPLSTLPDNPAYRIKLFLRRNLAASLAAAGTLLVVILVAVFALWQAYRARTEHLQAEARFAEVRKLSDVVLFDVPDTLAHLPGTTPTRRLLLDRALDYLNTLSKQANGNPPLQRDLANGYLRAGHLQGNPDYPNLGNTAGAIGAYRHAQLLLEPLLAQDPKNSEIAAALAATHEALATIWIYNGDPSAAIQSLRTAVLLRETANTSAESRSVAIHSLALALARIASVPEAQSLARKAHQQAMTLSGPTAPLAQARSHSRLAAVLQETGDTPAARESYRAALALYEQLAAATPLAPTPRRDLSVALEQLAALESRTGNAPTAAPLYQRSLQLRRELAVSDPQNLLARRDLAYALLAQGSFEDAVESFRQLSSLDPTNSLARQDLALAWLHHGNAQLQTAKPDAALTSYRQFLQTTRDWVQRDPANPTANRLLAVAQTKLATTLPAIGDRDAAVNNATSAIRVLGTLLEKDAANPLLRLDSAKAHWAHGRALSEIAAAAKQPSAWKTAEAELQRASQLFADLAKQNQLMGEDREAPQSIANQINACRQAAGL